MVHVFSIIKNIFIKEQWYYPPLNNEEQIRLFRGRTARSRTKKIEHAYKRACKLRDFEISNFWYRSKYFWGFISVVFGAYTAISISEFPSRIPNHGITDLHLDFCLLILGLLLTIIWLLVLIGSKAWYEHWEFMICFLENDVVGPLYKTGSFSRSRNYYSVSKLNIMLSWVFIFVWIALLAQYLCNGYEFSLEFISENFDWFVSITLVITFVFIFILVFGYPKPDRVSEEKAMYDQWGECFKKTPRCGRVSVAPRQ